MATIRSKAIAAARKQTARKQRGRTIEPTVKPLAGSAGKQTIILELLSAPSGTTIAAMMKASGWQQHSVRGFLAGIVRKKLKLNLVSEKKSDGDRVYRIGRKGAAAKPSVAPTSPE